MNKRRILALIELVFIIIALIAVIFKSYWVFISSMLIVLAFKIYYLYRGFKKK